jgi:restriction endonuclease Mrr
MNNKRRILPSNNQIENPLCKVLYQVQVIDHQEGVILKGIYLYLANHFRLSVQQRNYRMKDGRNHFQNRVQQAKRQLVDKGVIITIERGVWALSSFGIKELESEMSQENKEPSIYIKG